MARDTMAVRWLSLALLVMLGLLANYSFTSYRQAQTDGELMTRNLVQVLESHLSNDFAQTSGALDFIARSLSEADLRPTLSVKRQSEIALHLTDLEESFPAAGALTVFDADGTLRHAANPKLKGINIADRPHFRTLRDDPTAQIVFSDAEIARITGKWSIVMVRALRDERGRFVGTANAVIRVDKFSELFESIDVGPGGVTLLRRSDTSKLIQRMPRNHEQDFNQPLPLNNPIRQRIDAGERAGTVSLIASTDGVERLASFKTVDNVPFYVQVAIAKDHYLTGWKRGVILSAVLATSLLLAFVLAVWRIRKSSVAAELAAGQIAYREALFGGLFEQSSLLAGILDQSGRLLEVNQTALAVIGLQREQVIGQSFVEMPWWSRDAERATLVATLQAAAEGSAGNFEAVHPHAGGGEITVQFHAVPVQAEGKRYIAVTGIDITERVRAEKSLRESAAFAQGILNSMESQVAVIDANGQIVLINEAWRSFSLKFSQQPGQMAPRTDIGANYLDVCRRNLLAVGDEALRVSEGIVAVLERRLPTFSLEYPCHSPWEQRWFRLIVTPLIIDGEQGAVLVHDNITESKLAEMALAQKQQRLANILWGTGAGTWEWNVQTGETNFNERWAEIIGYRLDELAPVSIDTWTRLAHPDDFAQSGELLARHFAGQTDCYEFEARMRHKAGHWVWVLDRGKVISRTADGQPEWMAGTHSEITERKVAEEEIHDLLSRLQIQSAALTSSNAELEQFAYVASHDLRQPLRMVNSYVQLLERALADKLDDKTREMMHFATDGAKRMDQMLVSLLDYSRVGRKGEPLAPLASRSGVDEALRFLAPAIREANATVRVSGDWPQIVASRDEFTRLWQNLIGNAVKYRVPDRAPELDITVTPEGEGWRFCVADNGIGIDPAQFERLFKVFQRLHTRDQYEGTGIGLAVARKIVERHGGRIWVESGGIGLGCRFCFSLPATTAEVMP